MGVSRRSHKKKQPLETAVQFLSLTNYLPFGKRFRKNGGKVNGTRLFGSFTPTENFLEEQNV